MAVYQVTARRLSRSLTDFIRLLEAGLPWTNTVRMLVYTSEDFLGATMQSMIITANEPGLAQVWLVSEIVR